MKSISAHGLFFAAIFFALHTACGHSDSTSTLRDTTSQICADSAKSKRDSAYVDATKAFEANAAACYLLIDDQQYLPASLCLKKAGAARKQSILEADAAFTMAMSQCQSRA